MGKLTKFYQSEREKGVILSAITHLILLFSILVGLPELLSPAPPEPVVITVELLPVSDITNVKPMNAKKPKPKPKPEQKPKPPTKAEKKPTPPVKTKEPEPTPKVEKAEPTPEPVPEPTPDKKEEKKKEPEKKPEPKKEEKPKEITQTDLAAVLKAVKDTAKQEQEDEAKKKEDDKKSEEDDKKDEASKNNSTKYDSSIPMSLSEKDAIMSQIAKYWNVQAGAKDAYELVVMIKVSLRQDGEVLKVELANSSKARYNRDSFFRAAADSAIRAVRLASPIKNLPAEKYQTWRDMELRFDPAQMLY